MYKRDEGFVVVAIVTCSVFKYSYHMIQFDLGSYGKSAG